MEQKNSKEKKYSSDLRTMDLVDKVLEIESGIDEAREKIKRGDTKSAEIILLDIERKFKKIDISSPHPKDFAVILSILKRINIKLEILSNSIGKILSIFEEINQKTLFNIPPGTIIKKKK